MQRPTRDQLGATQWIGIAMAMCRRSVAGLENLDVESVDNRPSRLSVRDNVVDAAATTQAVIVDLIYCDKEIEVARQH